MSHDCAETIMTLYQDLDFRKFGNGARGTATFIGPSLIPYYKGGWENQGFLFSCALANWLGHPESLKISGSFKGLDYNPSMYKQMASMFGGEKLVTIERNLGGMKIKPNTFMHITYSDGSIYVAANGQPEEEEALYDELVALMRGNFSADNYDKEVVSPFMDTKRPNGAEIVRMLTFSYDPAIAEEKMKEFHKNALELVESNEAPFSEAAISYLFCKTEKEDDDGIF